MAENLTSFQMFMADCTGNTKNTLYPYPVKINTAEDLAAACLKDHVCTEFKEYRRSSKNFIKCHAIQGDCDNDKTEDPAAWITPADVAARLPGVAFYAVKSRNCDKVKHPGEPGEKSARPRWHYYFPLRVPMPRIDVIRNITARLLVVLPEFDSNGMKPAQPLFGHAEPVAEYHGGEQDIAEYLADHPEIIAEEVPADDEPAEPPERIQAAADSEAEFISMNLPDMLAVIPSDDYGDWIRVGMALKAAGVDVSVWDEWSKTSAKYKGYNDIVKKWNSFKGGKISAGTLVHMAQDNGWTCPPEKRTGEYAWNPVEWDNPITTDYNTSEPAAEIIDPETGEILPAAPAQDQQTTETVNGIKTHPANPAAAAPTNKEKDQLTTGGYDDVETKPTDFLFFPWFPRGKLVSVQGDSGSSKSTFMYAVGAYVTTGRDLLNVPCEDPGNVMFITIEDDPGDIKTAFLDAEGDLSRLKRIIDREQIAKLNLEPPGAQMLDKIIKAEQLKLLVLDPIQQFLTGDMNRANDTRPQLARLMNIAAANNICIVFIEHMGKDTTKAALHRAVGSVDIGAATRSMIQVVTDPEDDYFKIAFTVKNNTADFHDVQRAIRYQVKDHPGSVDPETKKRARFHGHAEFTELLPEYNERLYKKALRKADEAEEAEETLQFEYDDDPLVITARELVSYNPDGLFIATDDLIQKITIVCGRCPYDQTKSKTTGINSRIDKLRGLMIDTDGIQMDKQKNSVKPKPYNWRGEIYDPEDARKTRGLFITPVRTGASGTGAQQTKI